MIKKLGAILLVAALALSMGVVPAVAAVEPPALASCVTLWAGQNMDVGNVCVWNDGTNLYVQYTLSQDAIDEGWEITETHLYAGKNAPPTSAPGQFPYDDDDASVVSATEILYIIPLEDVDSYSMRTNRAGRPTGVMIADDDPGAVEPWDDVFIAAHAVISDAAKGQASGVIYGTRISDGARGLYEIDVVNSTVELLREITTADVGTASRYTNALAFDPASRALYFTAPRAVNVSPSPLWSYDIGTEELVGVCDLEGSVVAASFYDGAFYYIAELTNDLMKIEVNGGCSPEAVLENFGGEPTDFTFGDFAISSTGMLYGSTRVSPQMFFSLDLETWDYHVFQNADALDLQLAYGSNGKLYGVNHANGRFYEIDVETGMQTQLALNARGFSDLACGELFVPTIETAWGQGERIDANANWSMHFTYEVQFTSDWIEGMVLWLDAGVGVTSSSGVSLWEDQSGLGNDATQAVEANRPTLVAEGLSERPVVTFDGSSQWMELPSTAINTALNSADGFTIFLLMRGERIGTNEAFISSIDSTANLMLFRYGTFLPDFRVRIGGTDYDLDFATDVRDGDGHILVVEWDVPGNSRRLYVDGDVDAESTGSVQATITLANPVNIGRDARGVYYFGGDIAEILIYDRALADAEREAVEDYLMAKYGL